MAESFLKPPTELNVAEGNVSENVRLWRRQMELFLLASGADEKSKARQKVIILHCAGPRVQEICQRFIYDDDENSEDPYLLMQKLHAYCKP